MQGKIGAGAITVSDHILARGIRSLEPRIILCRGTTSRMARACLSGRPGICANASTNKRREALYLWQLFMSPESFKTFSWEIEAEPVMILGAGIP